MNPSATGAAGQDLLELGVRRTSSASSWVWSVMYSVCAFMARSAPAPAGRAPACRRAARPSRPRRPAGSGVGDAGHQVDVGSEPQPPMRSEAARTRLVFTSPDAAYIGSLLGVARPAGAPARGRRGQEVALHGPGVDQQIHASALDARGQHEREPADDALVVAAEARAPLGELAPGGRVERARRLVPGSPCGSRPPRSSTSASPAAASHCGDTKPPMPRRSTGSGTSATSVGPSARGPHSSSSMAACSTVEALTGRPAWSLPTAPRACIGAPPAARPSSR